MCRKYEKLNGCLLIQNVRLAQTQESKLEVLPDNLPGIKILYIQFMVLHFTSHLALSHVSYALTSSDYF